MSSYAPAGVHDNYPLIRTTDEVFANFTLQLMPGWNLVSFPFLLPGVDTDLISRISDLENVTTFLMASKWNSGTQNYVSYIPGFNIPTDPENFVIGPDDAFFIWVNSAIDLNITGYKAGQRSVNLVQGWNMVGYMGDIAGDVETDWAPQVTCGAYDDICYYDGTMFIHYIFAGTVMELTPGRGYFVWSDTVTTLIY